MFPFKLYYELFLHDKNGKLVWKSRKRASKSFVIQWLQGITAGIQSKSMTMKDITGTDRGARTSATLMMNAGTGVDNKGTVVGTGTTPPTNSDYSLEIKIAEGVGSGQLQHGSQGFTDPQVIAGNVDTVLTRAFTNGSGATITVREIGLYGNDATYSFCHVRDVLPAGVDVPNGQTLTVQYTVRTSA